MLMQIRRPVRPEPLPLRERGAAHLVSRIACIWLAVRQKRTRPATPLRPKIWLTARGPSASRK